MTEQQTQSVSYDTIAEAFSEEASSLLSDTRIHQVLEEEKIRFHNASLLGISLEKLVRHNTARYCKDLLRKQQPLSFLYAFLCFLTEIAVWLLPYGILIEICSYAASGHGSSFSIPSVYGFIVILGIVAGNTFSKLYLQKFLLSSALFSKAEPQNIKQAKASLHRFHLLLFLGVTALTACGIFLAFHFGWDRHFSLHFLSCFIAYAACILLSGIHNVIYSGHSLAFFTIGGLLLARRPDNEVEAATTHYLNLRYQQMLSPSHKTPEHLAKNPALEKKLRESLHSRMTTQRVYYALAIIILLALDVVCLIQLQNGIALTLVCFFVASVLSTAIFLFAFLCANHILKATRG